MNKNIEYAMAFSKIKGFGKRTLFKHKDAILSLKNDDNAYILLKQINDLNKRILLVTRGAFLDICENIHNTLEEQRKQEIHTISILDDCYPTGFKALGDPPLFFFLKGNKEALKKIGIAIIGTRHTTNYSRSIGERFGQVLAEKGWNVISGLAIGCDTAGHTGCLQKGGITTAIVGTPLNQVYPKQNEKLQEEILKNNGCVISEYMIDEEFSPYNLIARDRLQAAIAQGVIVVATGLKGGTYHAIHTAMKLEKPLACFSYSDEYYKHDIHSLGNQKMIETGQIISLRELESIDYFLELCTPKEFEHTIDNNKCEQLNLF